VLWFTANPNGEAETLLIKLKPQAKVRKLKFELDFSELAIKGRGAGGNRVTKYPISKIELKEKGVSTLAARKIWFDDTVQRLNSEERGEFLGEFQATDKILTITQSGYYKLVGFDLSTKFEDDMIAIEKWNPKKPIAAIYFDGDKKQFNVKRFLVEPTDKKVLFITEHEDSYLEIISTDWLPQIQVNFSKVKGLVRDSETILLEEFIAIKGLKAIGNRLTSYKVKNIDLLEPLPFDEPEVEGVEEAEIEGDINEDEDQVDASADEEVEELEEQEKPEKKSKMEEVKKGKEENPVTEAKAEVNKEKKSMKGVQDGEDGDAEEQMTLF
jgi:topoisomerase-4 subunit A